MSEEDSTLQKRDQETVSAEPGWRRTMRWIVTGNPFYPLSAVLVLLGVFLLSGEERMFRSELTQLIFNFGSVELYGLLIAATAVYLFRQQIYYDTLMLVVLAVLPMLVPFVLISQAALLGNGVMTTLCVLAAVLGWVQCGVLRRGVFELPLNRGLAVFVGGVLVLNVLLPVALKTLHAEADAIVWAVTLEQAGHWAWLLVLPLIALGGLLIGPLRRDRFGDCGVHWLPTVLILMFVAGTACHLWSVGYVYTFDFESTLMIPVVWSMAWLVWGRRFEWARGNLSPWSEYVIGLPVLVGAATFVVGDSPLMLALNLVNLVTIGAVLLRQSAHRALFIALAGALMCVVRAVPATWLGVLMPEAGHLELSLLIGSLLVLGISCFQVKPAWGIAAALAVLYPLHQLWSERPTDWLVIGQVALMVWWLHSLRWDMRFIAARVLQTICVVVWALHSVIWVFGHGAVGEIAPGLFALLFFATAMLMVRKHGGVRFWAFAFVAAGMISLNGLELITEGMRRIPSGLIILLSGLLLFGVGTVLACWRRQLLGKRVW